MINRKTYEVWQSLEKDATNDGLVCEIKIEKTSIKDWDIFLSFIEDNFPYEFYFKGCLISLPLSIGRDFFQNDSLKYLIINLNNIKIECSILSEEEIEFNVVPSLIINKPDIELFFNFLKRIGTILQKPILISVEGALKPYLVLPVTTDS